MTENTKTFEETPIGDVYTDGKGNHWIKLTEDTAALVLDEDFFDCLED